MTKDETTHPLQKWISEILFRDTTKKGVITRNLFGFVRLTTYLGREFGKDLCPQKASALAYTTVLSLVPVSALFVLYFKVAGKLDALSDQAQGWILQQFVAESAQDVTTYIDQFVNNMHTKTLGALGAVGLLVSAYLLFRTIDRSLNEIWKVRTHRSFMARFQILCTLLIVVPGFMIGSLYVSGKFQEIKVFGNVESLTSLMRTVFFMAPFLLTAMPFFVIFKFIPNTKVNWKPALFSAFFAAILFEIAKAGFNFYVLNIINVNKIYGALGLFPVLLLWIYFSWIIILLGVELSYVLQNFSSIHEEARDLRVVGPLDTSIHEEWGLRIACAMAVRFTKGEGAVTKEDLALDVGLKIIHVEDHLDLLIRSGWVATIEQEDELKYIFVRPLDQLSKNEILNIFRQELGLTPTPSGAKNENLVELSRALLSA